MSLREAGERPEGISSGASPFSMLSSRVGVGGGGETTAVASWHVAILQREKTRTLQGGPPRQKLQQPLRPLLVEAQHPIEDLQPNAIQAPQHVPALLAPPLKRLPVRILALLIARNPPRRTRIPFITSLAASVRASRSASCARAGLHSADARRVLLFERNERGRDLVRGWHAGHTRSP